MADAQDAPTLRAGLAQAVGEQFSFEKTIGGVRGLLESTVPAVVFSAFYGLAHEMRAALLAAVIVSVVFVVARLITRQNVQPAVSGLFGVVLAAGVALISGRAVDFFLLPLIKNGVFTVVYAVSALVGWPLVGVFLGFMLQEGTLWRHVPARRRVYHQATWLWTAMFALRFSVELPLYLRDHVVGLGAASVPLGLPLFGVVVLLTWLLIRRVPPARSPGSEGLDGPHEKALPDNAAAAVVSDRPIDTQPTERA